MRLLLQGRLIVTRGESQTQTLRVVLVVVFAAHDPTDIVEWAVLFILFLRLISDQNVTIFCVVFSVLHLDLMLVVVKALNI